VVAGSGPDATCSTTVRDAVLPISSSALAAVFLSGSGALPLIRPLSSSRPTFLGSPSAVSYGSCPPSMRALQCTLGWDIKGRDELRYSCTHTPNQSERSWIKAALGPDEWATSASADLWRRRSPMGPLDSQPVATILQTESSRQSTTTDEKCHPRP